MTTVDTPESNANAENLPIVHRVIASVVVMSSDGCILMGRKDPARGSVYPNVWHIPGGGVEVDESLVQAATRELREETGLSIQPELLTQIPIVGHGETVKAMEHGELVWCQMEFNRFEIRLDETADQLSLKVKPGDDLVELRWFSAEDLADIEQIPDGKEFLIEAGYIH